ncbi:MAG: hypothetical protein LBH19_09320, partial [Dysgonamonadaceae bacterium]|nr:hypothetical protein [Dysgonamonadaceae bacterium]
AAKTAKKRIGDYWKRSTGSFCFEPGKAYEFNIVIGDALQAVTVDVNSVNNFTAPGINVQRTWQVGDVYGQHSDGRDLIVGEVDECGAAKWIYADEFKSNSPNALQQMVALWGGVLSYQDGSPQALDTWMRESDHLAELQRILGAKLMATVNGRVTIPLQDWTFYRVSDGYRNAGLSITMDDGSMITWSYGYDSAIGKSVWNDMPYMYYPDGSYDQSGDRWAGYLLPYVRIDLN